MGYFSEDLVTGRGKHAGVRDIFKVVVQVVLIFGLEMWVMNPCMAQPLGILQNRVDHRLTERHLWWLLDGIW